MHNFSLGAPFELNFVQEIGNKKLHIRFISQAVLKKFKKNQENKEKKLFKCFEGFSEKVPEFF